MFNILLNSSKIICFASNAKVQFEWSILLKSLAKRENT
jgi:hypothetical protein